MTSYTEMNQRELRAACKEAGISGYGNMTVAQMREVLVARESAKTAREVVAKTTEPLRRDHKPRVALIERGSRINRHYNDDGSITLYSRGVKIHRTLSDQQIEDGEAPEDYDAEDDVARFCRRWFGSAAPVFGKTTHGHQWKSRRRVAEESAAATALLTDAAV